MQKKKKKKKKEKKKKKQNVDVGWGTSKGGAR